MNQHRSPHMSDELLGHSIEKPLCRVAGRRKSQRLVQARLSQIAKTPGSACSDGVDVVQVGATVGDL